jgi:predicted aldo/keto reductase-like oxidoreductase
MKTLGAGKLISAEYTPFERPLTVQQCIHYALTRPAVASVMLGCKSRVEVLDAVRYLDMSDEERDYAEVLGSLRNDFRGNCVYCSHCQPCPAEIVIAAVNKYLDIAWLDKAIVPPMARSQYQSLKATGERCPFGVPVIRNMSEAEQLLG